MSDQFIDEIRATVNDFLENATDEEFSAMLKECGAQPNPGSKEAIEAGCRCPVLDNGHGRGFPWPGCDTPQFWISDNCPVHGGIVSPPA